MSEVKIKIGADSSGFKKGANEIKGAFKSLNKDIQGFSSIAGGAVSSFLGNLSAIAVTNAFAALKNGFASAIGQVKEFANLASVQEDAIQKLNTSLALTGKFSQESSKGLQAFASELQNTSRFGDEVILKNAALIQTFGNLSDNALKRATQAAADFAQATGKSLDEASSLIAKASTGQVEALKRYGIMVENTGNVTKDFEKALGALEQKFGGSAKAALNTFSGATEQTSNIIGDFKESIGAVIIQNPIMIAAIKGVGDAFLLFQKQVNDNRDSIDKFVTEGIDLFIKSLSFTSDAIGFFIDISSGFKAFFAETTDLTLAAGQSIVEFAKTTVDASISITDFLGATTDAQRAAAASLETTSQVFASAREISEQKTLEEIAGNEALKTSISSVTESIQNEIAKRIELQKAESENSSLLQLEKLNSDAQARMEASDEELEFKALRNEEFLTQQRDFLGKATAENNSQILDKLVAEKKFVQAKLELQKQGEAAQRASFLGLVQYENQTQRERITNLKGAFSQISALQAEGSKELFAVGKAAALANATIDGIAAIQKALSAAPPPFNFALAAAVGAAQAINLKKIATAKPPTGAFSGALVEGGNNFRDTEPFMLSRGEIVAPRKSFDEVVEGTARQRGFVKQDDAGGGETIVNVNIQGDIIGEEQFVNNLIEKFREAIQFRNASLGV